MALPIKKNIPINTSNTIPNVNNLSDEATKLSQLVNKLNRSNAGQNNFTSTSSGITYNTLSYPTEPLIFNKGETGLYNLLIKLYGGQEGFLITADDWNLINGEIKNVDDKVNTVNTTLGNKIATNTNNITTNTGNITANTNNIATLTPKVAQSQQDITGIKSGSIVVGNATDARNAVNATYSQNAVNSVNATNALNCYTRAECNSTFKIKGDFYVVNTPVMTLVDGLASTNINYPSGFNATNCNIISVNIRPHGTTAKSLAYGFLPLSSGYVGGALGVKVALNASDIGIIICNPTDGFHTSGTNPYTCSIILMK